MLELGILVALGLLVTLAKLPWKAKMWVISHPLTIDAMVFIALTAVHWGTFSGVMVATIGAFFCSVVLSIARWLCGHVDNNRYFPGKFNMINKLMKDTA